MAAAGCHRRGDGGGDWLPTYAHRLISGSQVAANLGGACEIQSKDVAPGQQVCAPCEIQPIHEKQVRPLRILEPEVRGQLLVAAIRKNVRRHARVRLLLPLLHTPGFALGPFPGAAVPIRCMGLGTEGRRSLTAGRHCDGADAANPHHGTNLPVVVFPLAGVLTFSMEHLTEQGGLVAGSHSIFEFQWALRSELGSCYPGRYPTKILLTPILGRSFQNPTRSNFATPIATYKRVS
jgi:hypothetical protein